ncbi:MAG TPA: hypothetical protein VK130_04010 [Steroidobacteraceae bacterium]|nr:hypothetical protein [Steroidobacteraceae bacterium]
MVRPAVKPTIADTFTRLLRLDLAAGSPRLRLEQLMEESETELAQVARTGRPEQQRIAGHILGNPQDYRRWESEHLRLMTTVAGAPRAGLQVRALLSMAFSLTHRKALFDFLRERRLRGTGRRRLVRHFHGHSSYSQAVIAEHANYLQSAASLMCAERIGSGLLAHQAFGKPLRDYEQRYVEYFSGYCQTILGYGDSQDGDDTRALLTLLKQDVLALRLRLMAMPASGTSRR